MVGLGSNNLITIPTTIHNAIDLKMLRAQAVQALQAGRKIVGMIAPLGTTDAFGLDDLQGMVTLRNELVREFPLPYRPLIHADAVIGWAWSVFTDYSFEANPLGFRPRTVRALAGACKKIRHLSLADSIGIDFHKPGFAPYISSLILVQNKDNLDLLQRPPEQMPYLLSIWGTAARHVYLGDIAIGWGSACCPGKLEIVRERRVASDHWPYC